MSGSIGVMIVKAETRKCCVWPRAPATVRFYRTQLKKSCDPYNNRNLADQAPFEVDEPAALAGRGMSEYNSRCSLCSRQLAPGGDHDVGYQALDYFRGGSC